MKNALKFLGIIAIAAVITFSMAACGDDGDPLNTGHTHTPGIAATCTTDQVCTDCGDVLQAKLGHSPGVNATCTTAQTCTDCGDVLQVKLSHIAPSGTPAACESPGNTGTGACSRCGDHVDGEVIPALEHLYSATVPATCTEDSIPGICSRGCGIPSEAVVSAPGHNSSGAAANCVTPKKCPVCDYIIAAALRHNNINWATLNSATGHVTCDRSGCPGGLADLGATGQGGGKIFFRSDVGFDAKIPAVKCHYLEAAIADLPSQLVWAQSDYVSLGGRTERVIGEGWYNTYSLVFTATPQYWPAAYAFETYSSGGFSDWFLPSLHELRELYNNKAFVGAGTFKSDYYWSSTQDNSWIGTAYCTNFGNGTYDYIYRPKTSAYWVRPVRAF